MMLLLAIVGPFVVAALVDAAMRATTRDRARSLSQRARRQLPPVVRAAVEQRLRDAAVDVEPEVAVQLWVGVAGVAAILASALTVVLAFPAALVVIAGGPLGLRLARSRRSRLVHAALPGMLDTVAGDLRAGGTVRTALLALTAGDGVLTADLRRLAARLDLGLALPDALARWADERESVGVRAVAGALAVADGLGGRAADALEGLARSLRDADGAAAEARALSAQARLSAVVVGAAPLAYLAFQAATDPGSIGTLVETPAGQACLLVGLGLEALAGLWMRRIVGAVQ